MTYNLRMSLVSVVRTFNALMLPLKSHKLNLPLTTESKPRHCYASFASASIISCIFYSKLVSRQLLQLTLFSTRDAEKGRPDDETNSNVECALPFAEDPLLYEGALLQHRSACSWVLTLSKLCPVNESRTDENYQRLHWTTHNSNQNRDHAQSASV